MQVFSFKVRGAFNFLAHMSEDERRAGVICASAGNHAQGVAMAARHLVRSAPYALTSEGFADAGEPHACSKIRARSQPA